MPLAVLSTCTPTPRRSEFDKRVTSSTFDLSISGSVHAERPTAVGSRRRATGRDWLQQFRVTTIMLPVTLAAKRGKNRSFTRAAADGLRPQLAPGRRVLLAVPNAAGERRCTKLHRVLAELERVKATSLGDIKCASVAVVRAWHGVVVVVVSRPLI